MIQDHCKYLLWKLLRRYIYYFQKDHFVSASLKPVDILSWSRLAKCYWCSIRQYFNWEIQDEKECWFVNSCYLSFLERLRFVNGASIFVFCMKPFNTWTPSICSIHEYPKPKAIDRSFCGTRWTVNFLDREFAQLLNSGCGLGLILKMAFKALMSGRGGCYMPSTRRTPGEYITAKHDTMYSKWKSSGERDIFL